MINVQTLYETLFATLQAVKNGTMPIDQAKAVSAVGQTIINVARAEVDYARHTQQNAKSAFFSQGIKTIEQKPGMDDTSKPASYMVGTGKFERIGNVTTHTVK